MGDWLAHVEAWAQTPEGVAEEAAWRLEVERDEKASAARRAKEAFEIAGIPERYRQLILAPSDTKAMAAVRRLDSASGIVVLSGGTGCGKTVAACWWAWARGGVFEKAGKLSRRSHWDDTIDRLIRTPALAIDDLGVEYQDAKGFFSSLLDELVDTRYENNRATLITTNLGRDDFRARIGGEKGRIASRVRGDGAFISISDSDMRGATAA